MRSVLIKMDITPSTCREYRFSIPLLIQLEGVIRAIVISGNDMNNIGRFKNILYDQETTNEGQPLVPHKNKGNSEGNQTYKNYLRSRMFEHSLFISTATLLPSALM